MGTRVTRAAAHLSLEEVRQRKKREPRFWVRQRWEMIEHALLAPRKAEELAAQTGVSVRTVTRVVASYNRLGEEALHTPGSGGRRHQYLLPEQERTLLQSFAQRAEQGELVTCRHIQQAVEAAVSHPVHKSTISRLLSRQGWRKLVPRPYHPKADREEQAAFLAQFPALVLAALSTRDPADQRPVLLLAQDEARFGRLSTPRRAWVPPTVRPRAPRQLVREYLYVYAAVAPAVGQLCSLILPSVETAMMNVFLEHVSATWASAFLVMQLDQAGWHQAEGLVVPENIRLLPQPAYSPELNPVEHIWEDLREQQFPNTAVASLDEVIDRLCAGLTQLEADPMRLRAMTSFPHFRQAEEALRQEKPVRPLAA